MPGPISDSREPEFGTGANAAAVNEAATEVRDKITGLLGSELRDIVQVCREPNKKPRSVHLTERELRIMRFCINRALESL